MNPIGSRLKIPFMSHNKNSAYYAGLIFCPNETIPCIVSLWHNKFSVSSLFAYKFALVITVESFSFFFSLSRSSRL